MTQTIHEEREGGTFHTQKFIRRVEAVGADVEQPKVRAEVLSKAILAARFTEQNVALGRRVAELNASLGARFDRQDGRLESYYRSFV